jgi:hypothetical protein
VKLFLVRRVFAGVVLAESECDALKEARAIARAEMPEDEVEELNPRGSASRVPIGWDACCYVYGQEDVMLCEAIAMVLGSCTE